MKDIRAPFTRDDLVRLVDACDPNTLSGSRDRLLLALGWELAASRSTLAVLRMEDVQPDRNMIVVTAPGTARAVRLGTTFGVRQIANGPSAELYALLNMPRLVQGWRDKLAAAVGVEITTGPLFWSITRYDQLSHPGMTGDAINDVVQRAVHRAGLAEPWRYSAHSLRLGGRAGV